MIPKKSQGKSTVIGGIRRTAYLLLAVVLWIPMLSIGGGKAWAASGWSLIDGGGTDGLNVNAANRAEYPALAVWNGEVYVAWQEKVVPGVTYSQIRVKKYNGTGWTSVDGNGLNGLNMDPGKSGLRPTMAVFNGSLYLAWVETTGSSNGQIRVKKYNGTGWTSAEGEESAAGINDVSMSAFYPALIAYDNALYATYSEAGKVRVKRYAGEEWTSVDGGPNGLNKDPLRNATFPVMAVAGNELFVMWSELNGSNIFQLRAKKYDGLSWTAVDGDGANGLNRSTGKSAYSPSLAVVDGVLHAAWYEPFSGTTDDQIRVMKYVDNAWSSADGDGTYGINVNHNYRANYVKLAASNRELFAVWQESVDGSTNFKVRVKKYDGTTWTNAEAGRVGLFADSTKIANFPAVTILNSTVFVAWQEKNSTIEQLRLANYALPAVNGVTVTPDSATVRQGESQQLNVTVDASGGAATTVDWTSSDAKVTVDATGKVTVAADAVLGDYAITATSTVDGSKKGTATITVTEGLALEATPAAEIDYVTEQLTGLEPNGVYDIDGTTVSADGSGKAAIDGSWLGTTVSVVKKGNGTTTADSSAQTLSLPARPAAPTAGKTDETAINGSDGTLTNVTTAMAYKQGMAGSWTDIVGTSVTGLAPDAYYVRVKATSSAFASEPQSVTIATFNATSEATPAAEIDYVTEQLTGLEPNGVYDIDGTTVSADGSGKAAIDGSWLGRTVSVVKKGNGTTTADSSAQTLSLPARPAAPVDITVTDITYNGANDGSIININITMEYKQGDNGSWTRATGTSVVGLETGVYYVRVAATESSFASIPALVTIHDSNATIPAAPNVSADDTNNAIVGVDTTMEFAVDGGAYIRYDGTNIPRLDGEHTVQVRVAASGSVPAGPAATLIFTTNVAVPAGGLTVTASDPSGTANNGQTRITVTPDVEDEHRLVYFNFGSDTVDVPNVGDTLSGYLNVPSDGMIPAANNDKIGVAEVDAQGQITRFGHTAAIVIDERSSSPSVVPTETPGLNEETVNVLVNGKVENAGKAKTTETAGIKTTTIVVDPVKLRAKLETEGVNAVVTIPVASNSNVIVGELNGQMVKNMEALSATLVLQTDKATYTLPAHEIAIDEVARQLGSNVKLEDIRLQISVANTPAAMAQVVENAAAKGEFSVVVPALDFTVTGTYGGNTVEVTTFNAYVERMVLVPEGIDPSRITTGIVVEPDGTVRHVPTKIVRSEGRYYATINSLTNSTYSVIWHPLEFHDVASHWAQAAVNDMGSRMVIDGTGEGRFSPDRAITRAEFAAILVRGLGLKLENGPTAFSDVEVSDWFSSSINTAHAYELISGYDDGSFRPNEEITREEAMTILARAMSITGLKAKTSAQSIDLTLQAYRDASNVSGWARNGVAINVEAGLVTGRSSTELAPLAPITRAEAATVIRRLLQGSDLIN